MHISHFIIYDYFSFSTGSQNNISSYSDLLRAEYFGVQTLVEVRFSAPIQMYPGVHPASCTMGTGSRSLREINWGMALTTHPFRAEVKEGVEYTSPPLWAFLAWPRESFTFTTFNTLTH